MLFDQVAIEAVMTGGHGRVGGEDRVLRHLAQGRIEAHAVVLHPRADGLQRGERAVAFVEMEDARGDSDRPQGPHAAHAGHQLLAHPGAIVAAVEPRGQLAIFRAIAGHVGIQQEKVDPTDAHPPDLGQQLARTGLEFRTVIGLPSAPAGGLHRQVFDLGVEILLLLPAVDVEVLLEIALVVEQPAGHQRHAQAAGALDVVAGEYAETARVDRHRLVNAELQGEIGHRFRSEHAGVGPPPGRRHAHVFLQSPEGLVDAAVQHQFGGPHLQPLGSELREQGDRVMVQLAPANGIEVAKEIDDLSVPAQPQIAGQGHALVVERFGCKSKCRWRLRLSGRKRFNLTHTDLPLRDELNVTGKRPIIASRPESGDPTRAFMMGIDGWRTVVPSLFGSTGPHRPTWVLRAGRCFPCFTAR